MVLIGSNEPEIELIYTKRVVKIYELCLLTHAQAGISSPSQSPKTLLVLISDPLDPEHV